MGRSTAPRLISCIGRISSKDFGLGIEKSKDDISKIRKVMSLCLSSVFFLSLTPYCLANTQSSTEATAIMHSLPNNPKYNKEIQAFIQKLVDSKLFGKKQLETLLKGVHFSEESVQLVAQAASNYKKNWQLYHNNLVNPQRIRAGSDFLQKNKGILSTVEKIYGIPKEIIVAIIGIETSYGKNMGNFRVIDALSTLAFYYPATDNQKARKEFFKEELSYFLLWCKKNKIDPFSVRGSFAGAIGIPQFMPSSLLYYAKSANKQHTADVIHNSEDAIISVGNFLQQHGWRHGRPIVWKINSDEESLNVAKENSDGKALPHITLEKLIRQGLILNEPSLKNKQQLKLEYPTLTLLIDLPTPNQATEYFLGLKNFYVLTRYNRSFLYAMAVYQLAQEIQKQDFKKVTVHH